MINYLKIRLKTNEEMKCKANKVNWNLENCLLLCCQRIEYKSLSTGLKIADLLYQPLLESQGFFNSRLWSGIIVVVLTELGSWTSPDSFEMFCFNAVRRGLESNLGPSGGWTVE